MAKLRLSFACALYDRMQPLYTGEVQPAGIELNFIPIEEPRPIFDRMSGGLEFDVAEYSSSEFVQRFANKQCPFVAIPVFPSRAFRHGFIAINKKSGITKPKDLEGKRVGVPLYTMTAAIFIRGLLQHEFGVDFEKIHWVQGAVNHAGAHGKPTVLPLLKHMFNLRALRYMTPFLMRDIDEIYEIFNGDPWPYGVEKNRKTLEALVTFLVDQHLIAAPVKVDDLFVPTYG